MKILVTKTPLLVSSVHPQQYASIIGDNLFYHHFFSFADNSIDPDERTAQNAADQPTRKA
ncbi:hypothetical protein RD00_23440 [Pseudomonas amygdali pv. tabaci]|nr:hypothetical protein RD00_23440 [Pseudomonas amygdali pv. tabaci]